MLGAFLFEQRMIKGLTEQELADELNVSPLTIKRWEKNRHIPKRHHLYRIKDFFIFDDEQFNYLLKLLCITIRKRDTE